MSNFILVLWLWLFLHTSDRIETARNTNSLFAKGDIVDVISVYLLDSLMLILICDYVS